LMPAPLCGLIGQNGRMDFNASGLVIYWRGPSPFHFVRVGARNAAQIRELAAIVSYGWGMIPVAATIHGVEFTTSLFAKDGDYLLPLRMAVRKSLSLEVGDHVTVRFSLNLPRM
jgi:hypothetical protein